LKSGSFICKYLLTAIFNALTHSRFPSFLENSTAKAEHSKSKKNAVAGKILNVSSHIEKLTIYNLQHAQLNKPQFCAVNLQV
jgi:hypothetical protein